MKYDFENIKKGDFVYLKPEWMDKGDEYITFIASEDYQGRNTIYISDLDNTMPIVPTHMVRLEMLEAYENQ